MDWRRAEAAHEPNVTRDTLAETFHASAREHADRVAQRYKGGIYDRSLVRGGVIDPAPDGGYAGVTYGDALDVVRHLSAGFRVLGVEPGDRVGIFAHTRMEWAQADFALLGAGGVVTTVYTSSSESQLSYLLSDSDADGVVVENRELLDRVFAVEDDVDLSFVVLMDGEPHDREDVYTLAELCELGREADTDGTTATDDATANEADTDDDAPTWIADRTPDDPASLIYTSGTTGQPKGAILTHRNFTANVRQTAKRFGPRPDKEKRDVPVMGPDVTTLSFLPLAHVFERLSGHFFAFAVGATVAYAESPDSLREDFQLVQPDVATSVPRVYEKLYAAIREQASESPIKQRIFRWATGVGRAYHRADEPGPLLRGKYALADRLVFSTVKEALGGNIDFFISGGGSLSAELCELYHGMGLPVLEGYGLTETAPVVSANPYEEPRVGTIGPPVADVDVRLDERVAAADTEGDRIGELLVRGPNVFDGYWNKPTETDAAFVAESELPDRSDSPTDGSGPRGTDDSASAGDEGEPTAADGGMQSAGSGTQSDDVRWFRTGDVVSIGPDGYMTFQERAKQLLKLSTGKYVPPGAIEDGFAASEVVEQAMVVGDARKFVGAIVVPNVEGVRAWADSEGIDLPDDPAAICADDRVHERIQRAVDEVNESFERHERIKRFRLVPDPFTEDNDLLTPTLKKKRRNIREYYADEIDAIYEDA